MVSNPLLMALRWVAFALVVPGMFAELVTGTIYMSPLWAIAAINFLFWFGFAWLVGVFLSKLAQLRRALAASRIPGDGSSSLGSK